MTSAAFRWHPSNGPGEAALARMRKAFPRPDSPMGEAWFMGETRYMFTNLMGDLDGLPIKELDKPLEEIAGGASSFGPSDEWRDWFHYLLPRLIPRANESWVSTLGETLVTAFMAVYPAGVVEPPYKLFREDAINTLGRVLVLPSCWHNGRIVLGAVLHRHAWPDGRWGWHDASGDLSASMAFLLKYLTPDDVQSWIRSALLIECPYWHAQLLTWFVGGHGLLTGDVKSPSELQRSGEPAIHWNWSHCLKGDPSNKDGPFFPPENRRAVLDALAESMNEEILLQWLASIAELPELEAELFDIPDQFMERYL
ncbi:hypothetical protein [Devosia lacusdianchii]|uniref:hypothetical protein n=1 Tax=Devosia lacusdianchii TaxID=2917991 RepID=UPI001F068173|nr:hypothetical protein [Devosia sp. JXJ CY 41]